MSFNKMSLIDGTALTNISSTIKALIYTKIKIIKINKNGLPCYNNEIFYDAALSVKRISTLLSIMDLIR